MEQLSKHLTPIPGVIFVSLRDCPWSISQGELSITVAIAVEKLLMESMVAILLGESA